MHFDWSTFALQTVNFAILVWLLHRFLYQPVLRLVDVRRTAIEKQYAAAHAAEETAETRLAAIEKERAGIAAERSAAMTQAAVEAEEQAAGRRAAAEHDAPALIEGARKTIAARSASGCSREARRQAFDLAADIAAAAVRRITGETSSRGLDRAYREPCSPRCRNGRGLLLRGSSAACLRCES